MRRLALVLVVLATMAALPASAGASVIPGPNGPLLFTSGRDDGMTALTDGRAQIWFLSGPGGAATRLTTLGLSHHRHATWSPDRTKIAFARGPDGRHPLRRPLGHLRARPLGSGLVPGEHHGNVGPERGSSQLVAGWDADRVREGVLRGHVAGRREGPRPRRHRNRRVTDHVGWTRGLRPVQPAAVVAGLPNDLLRPDHRRHPAGLRHPPGTSRRQQPDSGNSCRHRRHQRLPGDSLSRRHEALLHPPGGDGQRHLHRTVRGRYRCPAVRGGRHGRVRMRLVTRRLEDRIRARSVRRRPDSREGSDPAGPPGKASTPSRMSPAASTAIPSGPTTRRRRARAGRSRWRSTAS